MAKDSSKELALKEARLFRKIKEDSLKKRAKNMWEAGYLSTSAIARQLHIGVTTLTKWADAGKWLGKPPSKSYSADATDSRLDFLYQGYRTRKDKE